MNPQNEDIKRWTARRKAEVVLDIIKGKTTSAEVARSHDLTIGEIEQWMEDFTSMGTEALRSHPRDAEALYKAREKDLLAKIGDLTMQMEVYKIACEVQGKPLPDVRS
jgi:transposase-like protein